jgi:hypothetical protein
MKKIVTLAALVLTPLLTQAQDHHQPQVVKSVWRAAFLAPGLMHEARLGNRTTLVSEARISANTITKKFENPPAAARYESSSTLNPDLAVGVRHF